MLLHYYGAIYTTILVFLPFAFLAGPGGVRLASYAASVKCAKLHAQNQAIHIRSGAAGASPGTWNAPEERVPK